MPRRMRARFAGRCAACNATIPKGADMFYGPARRVACVACGEQHARDIAADDFDMMSGGY